jgi:hypothetical protein
MPVHVEQQWWQAILPYNKVVGSDGSKGGQNFILPQSNEAIPTVTESA